MPTALFLPSEEDTKVVITVHGKEPVSVDIFDLEDMFVQAQSKGEEMGTSWKEEFPHFFKKATTKQINESQAILLWQGVQVRLAELKKSLLNGFGDSSKPESPSTPRRKSKQG